MNEMQAPRDLETAAHVDVRRLPRSGIVEKSVTIGVADDVEAALARYGDGTTAGAVVFGRTYVSVPSNGAYSFPVTRILQKDSRSASSTAGMHLHLVENANLKPLVVDERIVGMTYEDEYARYCYLGGLSASDADLPRSDQARQMFPLIERSLGVASMDFANVVRTWYYLDEILSWYVEFNGIRGEFFTQRGVFDGLVPASTGIGGRGASGAALTAEVFAVSPKDGRTKICAVPSPLQCPALQYGSSFSRAVEIAMPDHQRLLVSGTASIGMDGKTKHEGDVAAQVELTMNVVEAILESRDMGWEHVTRAVAYFKARGDESSLGRYTSARGLLELPVILVNNDVCRGDLLFELEVDAVTGVPD